MAVRGGVAARRGAKQSSAVRSANKRRNGAGGEGEDSRSKFARVGPYRPTARLAAHPSDELDAVMSGSLKRQGEVVRQTTKPKSARRERWLDRHPSSVPKKKAVELAVLGEKRPRPWVARNPPAKRREVELTKTDIEEGILDLLGPNNTNKRARQDLEVLLQTPADSIE